MSNVFKRNETVVINCSVTGLESSISEVTINITDKDDYPIVYSTCMQEKGNQLYRYYWDTSPAYSGYSYWSGYSTFSGVSGVVTSGYSGYSGYSAYVSGVCNVTIQARDSDGYYAIETDKVRVNS